MRFVKYLAHLDLVLSNGNFHVLYFRIVFSGKFMERVVGIIPHYPEWQVVLGYLPALEMMFTQKFLCIFIEFSLCAKIADVLARCWMLANEPQYRGQTLLPIYDLKLPVLF
ncbi:hypothetical protein CBM2589_B10038 [Cupriavidus taiwanensis]|uniref:Uncharacterized protein n=1 Tax=Cupriavidus taiwanensis TaxID=164546 RepID=A0A975WNG8_9BURK|nr:hypothetical protein CBM2589_B10038 [Cupriavidus taiwanensis]